MSFRVLSCDDVKAWHALLQRFPARMRDLHYLPEYGAIYRDTYGFDPMLALWDEQSVCVVHAFVMRSLDALPCVTEIGAAARRYADVATPYGYGGPLVCAPTEEQASRALRAFDEHWQAWCRDRHVPAEFVCLHPLLENAPAVVSSGIAQPDAVKKVVVIDLTQHAWSDLSRGTRSSVQRARRDGVVVSRVVADETALAAFRELYLRTMHRRGAADRWFFPESYFPACTKRMGEAGSALFFATVQGELAAAYLLLRDEQTAYYHFGASDERWLGLRPNNLLMYETLLWAKAQGCTRYHLGGGVTSSENDSLLRFKSSYGGGVVDLYTYGRVLDAGTYRELCELKRGHEARHGIHVVDHDYFPFYRR